MRCKCPRPDGEDKCLQVSAEPATPIPHPCVLSSLPFCLAEWLKPPFPKGLSVLGIPASTGIYSRTEG